MIFADPQHRAQAARALYGVLVLSLCQALIYAGNLDNRIDLAFQTTRAFLQGATLLVPLWALLWLLTRDIEKSLGLALWNGHLFFRFWDFLLILPYATALALLFGLMACGSLALLLAPRLCSGFNRLALVFLHVVALWYGVDVVLKLEGRRELSEARLALAQDFDASAVPKPLPDIYQVIVDAYASNGTLRRLYGFDNSEFLDFLESSGFFVASESTSNYAQTRLSLHSLFNADFLQNVYDLGDEATGRRSPRYGQSGFQAILQELGYEMVYVNLKVLEDPDGDDGAFLKHERLQRSRWDVLDKTPLRQLLTHVLGPGHRFDEYEVHRRKLGARVHGMRQEMLREADVPRLVLTHLLLPHPPFVFGLEGENAADWQAPFFTYDGKDHAVYGKLSDQTEQEHYRSGYVTQLRYTNTVLRSLVETFLATAAKRPAILLIHADHGPASTWTLLGGARPQDLDVRERFGILNAFYFSDAAYADLYPSISLVNTFRVVSNRFLGQDYPLLEDRAYLSPYADPHGFTEVTDLLRPGDRPASATSEESTTP